MIHEFLVHAAEAIFFVAFLWAVTGVLSAMRRRPAYGSRFAARVQWRRFVLGVSLEHYRSEHALLIETLCFEVTIFFVHPCADCRRPIAGGWTWCNPCLSPPRHPGADA